MFFNQRPDEFLLGPSQHIELPIELRDFSSSAFAFRCDAGQVFLEGLRHGEGN